MNRLQRVWSDQLMRYVTQQTLFSYDSYQKTPMRRCGAAVQHSNNMGTVLYCLLPPTDAHTVACRTPQTSHCTATGRQSAASLVHKFSVAE